MRRRQQGAPSGGGRRTRAIQCGRYGLPVASQTPPVRFNLADIWEFAAGMIPHREALVVVGGPNPRRLTYGEVEARANRLAHALVERGVKAGDHVGLYLRNGSEYVEGFLAAFKVRAVPINVNYRYVADELAYLFDDAGIVALVHHAEFTDRVAAVAGGLPALRSYLSVADGTDVLDSHAASFGLEDYETVLAASSPERGFAERSGDDHYVLYTGGTTGMPKGVVWRQEDAFFACIGGGDPTRYEGVVDRPDQLADRVADTDTPFTFLPVAPLMHAAAQWTSLSWLYAGGRVVLMPGSLDPDGIWQAVQDEKVNLIVVVGDAVARPLLDAFDAAGGHDRYDTSSLFAIGSGGAPLTPSLRRRLAATFPNSVINDGFGSSETGAQGARQGLGADDADDGPPRFDPLDDNTVVLADDLRPVEPGSGQIGRVALRGHIPVGYHNDPEKTAATFVEARGQRWVITGDMAQVGVDGSITLLGRGSGCINTGGEKVFPEEVESVLKAHGDVYDVLVVGIDDERWGQTVAAVVQPVDGAAPTAEVLAAHCRAHLAGYKVPRTVVLVDEIVRSPVGKADYRWAKSVASVASSA